MTNIFICIHNLFKYKRIFSLIKSKYEDVYYEYKFSKNIPVKSDIVIYGLGPYGAISFVDLYKTNKVVAIVDANIKNYPIISPNNIIKLKFDYIIITIMNFATRKEVTSFLVSIGVPYSKIVFVQYDEYIGTFKK